VLFFVRLKPFLSHSFAFARILCPALAGLQRGMARRPRRSS
jgi:hypothetical protein